MHRSNPGQPSAQGLEIRRDVRAPEITALLEALMGKLEKDRAVVPVSPACCFLPLRASRSCPRLLVARRAGLEC